MNLLYILISWSRAIRLRQQATSAMTVVCLSTRPLRRVLSSRRALRRKVQYLVPGMVVVKKILSKKKLPTTFSNQSKCFYIRTPLFSGLSRLTSSSHEQTSMTRMMKSHSTSLQQGIHCPANKTRVLPRIPSSSLEKTTRCPTFSRLCLTATIVVCWTIGTIFVLKDIDAVSYIVESFMDMAVLCCVEIPGRRQSRSCLAFK
jgi:hypothetical protein